MGSVITKVGEGGLYYGRRFFSDIFNTPATFRKLRGNWIQNCNPVFEALMASPSRFLPLLLVGLMVIHSLSAESTPPKPITTVAPVYPPSLLSDPITGKAVVQFVVNAEGRVEDAIVKSADHEAFGVAALEAVAGWTFEPATKDGEPIARKVSLPMEFQPSSIDLINRALGRTVFARFDEEAIPLRTIKQRPRPKLRPKPAYPTSKMGSGEEKRIRVRFLIGKDGATYNPEVLDEVEREWRVCAVATVARMQFEPMKYQGEVVMVEVPGFPVLITENPPQPGQGRSGGGGGGAGGGRGR